jgi:hypothetical protein
MGFYLLSSVRWQAPRRSWLLGCLLTKGNALPFKSRLNWYYQWHLILCPQHKLCWWWRAQGELDLSKRYVRECGFSSAVTFFGQVSKWDFRYSGTFSVGVSDIPMSGLVRVLHKGPHNTKMAWIMYEDRISQESWFLSWYGLCNQPKTPKKRVKKRWKKRRLSKANAMDERVY